MSIHVEGIRVLNAGHQITVLGTNECGTCVLIGKNEIFEIRQI